MSENYDIPDHESFAATFDPADIPFFRLRQGAGGPSRCRNDRIDTTSRTDPYYGVDWVGRGEVGWLRHTPRPYDSQAVEPARRSGRGRRGATADWTWHAEHVLEALREDPLATTAALGAIRSWRTPTTEQIVSITGFENLRSKRSIVLDALHRSGVCLAAPSPDRSDDSRWRGGVVVRAGGTVWAPGEKKVFEQLCREFTQAEWLAIGGTTDWSGTGREDVRHNVLATEFGLRVAEYSEQVVAVLGEKHSPAVQLCRPPRPQHWSGPRLAGEQDRSRKAADLTLVRTDGLRVAIEITNNWNQSFKAKVAAWCEAMVAHNRRGAPLVVVFVTARDRRKTSGPDRMLHSRVRDDVLAATQEARHRGGLHVSGRIGVVEWERLFPSEGTLSEDAMALPAQFPPAEGVRDWQERAVLDPAEFSIATGARAELLALADNATVYGQTPYWLRDGRTPPDLAARANAALGWPKEGLVPPPSRDDRTVSSSRGSTSVGGAADDAQLPRRVAGLGRLDSDAFERMFPEY